MDEIKRLIPTCYEKPNEEAAEFGNPEAPVLVSFGSGVRIVLGAHDYLDLSKPDLLIERRAHGWAIILHSVGGADPNGCLYFFDDGRCFLEPEVCFGSEPLIEVVDSHDSVSGIDGLAAAP